MRVKEELLFDEDGEILFDTFFVSKGVAVIDFPAVEKPVKEGETGTRVKIKFEI